MNHHPTVSLARGMAVLLFAMNATVQAQENPPPAPAAAPAEAAQSDMQKWIATTDAPWQAAFKRDVTDVREADVRKVMLQYLTLLEDAIKKASLASDLDGAVALRNEQKRFGDTQLFPEQDEAGDPAAAKQARVAIRAQLVQVEKNSAVRAKALHAKYDQVLAQAQTQLTQRQRLDDALLVKAKRDEVAGAWLAGSPADAPAQPAQGKPAAGTPVPAKTKVATQSPSLIVPLNARPAEAMTIYASGSNGNIIYINGKEAMKAGRDTFSSLKHRLREGDVIAVKNQDRFDINSFWLSCIASTGEFLFETNLEWMGYIPGDYNKWWNMKNIKEQKPAGVAPDRQEYVYLVRNSASQTPLYNNAQPIRSAVQNSNPAAKGNYLYYIVKKADLVPKRDWPAAGK